MTKLPPNTPLQGRYRIVQPIGEGGFGAVYEAIDERLNRRVAVKQLLRINERISRQFTREAQLLANLNHPALPRVSDHFSDADGQFLVMDFIPGDDLATILLRQDAPFPLPEVLAWGSVLLDALHYLHTRQPPIIHRDIKPQNMKLQADGSIMLLDFGLAKGFAGEVPPPTTESSFIAYTKGFASPEQVDNEGTDARSDVYSLGATLHCLLTNTVPPEAPHRQLALMRGKRDPLRPAYELNPAIPVAVSEVLTQALALEPQERPQSALAFRKLLQDASVGIPPPPVMVDAGVAPRGVSEPTVIEIASTVPTQTIAQPPQAPPRKRLSPAARWSIGGVALVATLLVIVGLAMALGGNDPSRAIQPTRLATLVAERQVDPNQVDGASSPTATPADPVALPTPSGAAAVAPLAATPTTLEPSATPPPSPTDTQEPTSTATPTTPPTDTPSPSPTATPTPTPPPTETSTPVPPPTAPPTPVPSPTASPTPVPEPTTPILPARVLPLTQGLTVVEQGINSSGAFRQRRVMEVIEANQVQMRFEREGGQASVVTSPDLEANSFYLGDTGSAPWIARRIWRDLVTDGTALLNVYPEDRGDQISLTGRTTLPVPVDGVQLDLPVIIAETDKGDVLWILEDPANPYVLSYNDRKGYIRKVTAIQTPGATSVALPTIEPMPTGFDIGRLAFAIGGKDDSRWQIYTMIPVPNMLPQLLEGSGTAEDYNPVWSPDGTKIAFISQTDDNRDIWLMDAEGTNARLWTGGAGQQRYPSWSPDGTELAFTAFAKGAFHIFVKDRSGDAQRDLGEGGNPQWGADGNILFSYTGSGGLLDIWRVTADGGTRTNLTKTAKVTEEWAVLSPDGTRIVYVANPGTDLATREIWVMDVDGGNRRQLTAGEAPSTNPVWSPDGSQIAFVSRQTSPDWQIWVMNSDGSGTQQLTFDAGKKFYLSWTR